MASHLLVQDLRLASELLDVNRHLVPISRWEGSERRSPEGLWAPTHRSARGTSHSVDLASQGPVPLPFFSRDRSLSPLSETTRASDQARVTRPGMSHRAGTGVRRKAKPGEGPVLR